MSVTLDKSAQHLVFDLRVKRPQDMAFVGRELEVRYQEDWGGREGFEAKLIDASGELVWELDQYVDITGPHYCWLIQKTSTDSMIVEQYRENQRFSETYSINGTSRRFSFETGDVEKINTMHERVLSNGNVAAMIGPLGPKDMQIAQTLEDFHGFYVSGNSLHNNWNGVLMKEFLSSELVRKWLGGEYSGDSSAVTTDVPWEEICHFAFICVELKCPEGINPACNPCAAVAVVCVIVKLGKDLSIW